MRLSRCALYALSVLLLPSLIAACGTDAPPMGQNIGERDSLPSMTTRGISEMITDSGYMRYKIVAEEWEIYDRTTPPRWAFRKGLYLQRYDPKFVVNMHITADTAWLIDQTTWLLRGRVVLDDRDSQVRIATEQLNYNMRTGELASNVFTRLTEPAREIEGNWFRATLSGERLTHYHIRQSKGFMPLKLEDAFVPPTVEEGDTIGA